MIDSEKVTQALEICTSREPGEYICNKCPYETRVDGDGCEVNLMLDALTLLKEQEAVKPKSKVRHGANAPVQHFCGNCMTLLHGKPKYCSECGKKVYWHDRQ